jgi:hypothetical protein
MEVVGRKKYSCKYPGCNNWYYVNVSAGFVNKHFFTFPKDAHQNQLWKDACEIDEVQNVEHWKICEDHFEASSFVNERKERLNTGSVPKLYEHSANGNFVLVNTGKFAFLEGNSKDSILSKIGLRQKELTPRKSTMYKAHRNVKSRLVKLSKLLEKERSKVTILQNLHNEGKFVFIVDNVNFVTKEFINSQLNEILMSNQRHADGPSRIKLLLYLCIKEVHDCIGICKFIFNYPCPDHSRQFWLKFRLTLVSIA